MERKTATAREQPSPANIGDGGKNSRRQPPAETVIMAAMDQKFLFQPVGTENVEYLGRSPVCSEKISDRTARSIFN